MRKNKTVPNKEVDMTSIADVSVDIQTGSRVCSLNAFLVRGGCADHPLSSQARHPFCYQFAGALGAPPFGARRRSSIFWPCSQGYEILGERTLEAFYERLLPFAEPFMALFDRQRLPSRSALSRFLASFTPAAVEALRALFLEDLLARPLTK
jgi:hypothetical protein